MQQNNQIMSSSSRFEEVYGLTMELWGMVDSHQTYIFRVTGSNRGFGCLYFTYVMDVEFMVIMHDVRLRIASQLENESLLARLTEWQLSWITPPMDTMGYHPDVSRVAIDSAEGTFFIWAQFLEISWSDDPDVRIERELARLRRPLWTGGPALCEL